MSPCLRSHLCPGWVAMGLAVVITGYTILMKGEDKYNSSRSLPAGLRKRYGAFVLVATCILCM